MKCRRRYLGFEIAFLVLMRVNNTCLSDVNGVTLYCQEFITVLQLKSYIVVQLVKIVLLDNLTYFNLSHDVQVLLT